MIKECNFKHDVYCTLSNQICSKEDNCILYQIYNKLDELHISYSEDNKWNWSKRGKKK